MKNKLLILFLLVILFSIVPHEVYANIDKPFYEKDKNYDENIVLAKSKYTEKTLNELKNKLTNPPKSSEDKRYMVQFRGDISLDEINNLIEGYKYKIIGRSTNRLFRIDINEIEEFKELFTAKVEYIEMDAQKELSIIPNDPYVSSQWAINTLSLPEAWEITKGSNSISVAVIDSGVSRNHPDLSNEKILQGWDLIHETYVSLDPVGHGTEVTGVIAATPNNEVGITGTCWNVSIIPYAVVHDDGTIYSSDVVQAIYLATDAGCKVINISLGGSTNVSAEDSAIQYAISKGCIVVAAAGNDGNSTMNYPASYDNVISVASIKKTLVRSIFSNNNNYIDVCAPGEGIYTTTDDNSYAKVAGTSFSTPYVSGIAALAAACIPSLTSTQFQNAITMTSADLGTAGYDHYYGYGLINARSLLEYLTPPTAAPEYFTQFLITLGVSTNHGNTPGIYIGIDDIVDSHGNPVLEERLARYKIELDYDSANLEIPEVYDEVGLGAFTRSITDSWVSISAELSLGFENNSQLVFVPILLKGSAKNTTNVTIRFSELEDQFQNSIQAEPVLLTFQRGKVLKDENTKPTLSDAVAGLQYLADLGTVGAAKGQVNPVNMASILPRASGTGVLKPSVKDIIALLQYIVGLRNDYFLIH